MLYNSRPLREVRLFLLCHPCITIAKEAILSSKRSDSFGIETVILVDELYCNEVELELLIKTGRRIPKYSVVECLRIVVVDPPLRSPGKTGFSTSSASILRNHLTGSGMP